MERIEQDNIHPMEARQILGVMTEDELALALGVTVRTLANWRGAGKGPAYTKPEKEVYYSYVDVIRWLSEARKDPAALAAQAQRQKELEAELAGEVREAA